MHQATDGSLNRHGGQADMESNADERARERAEAVEARAHALVWANGSICPECEERVTVTGTAYTAHLATCELLRARAENEVDGGAA